jgi:glycosyltransferase involved in cell wall biosynthesis
MNKPPFRLLTVGHSYVVALNRRLPNEIARVSGGRWEVTTVAPRFVRADLRDIKLETDVNELSSLEAVNAYATKRVHILTFGLRLREILRRDWDMVHIFQDAYVVPGWQSAYWTPRKTPFVFYSAQNLRKNYPPPFSWMENYCVDHCAGWIGCGELVVDALMQKGYGRKPHRCIGFGVDVETFRRDDARRCRIRQELDWDDSVPVVAFLGRFVPEKGLGLLMSVLDRVSSPWRALFIGSGPMGPAVADWSAKYPGRSRVVAANHDEVPEYLNAADILCVPSQTESNWKEQFGRMIIEGFASGLAVVGSDSGEIPFVIGDAGIVVGEKDQSGWVRTLERLIEDDALRVDLSSRGRARAEEQFAWPVIARQHLEFFEELLCHPASSAAGPAIE